MQAETISALETTRSTFRAKGARLPRAHFSLASHASRPTVGGFLPMISWIQRTFQRHFALVFAFLLFAMAVPLIVIFNPSSGFGRGDRKIVSRPFFGLNLASQDDQQRLVGDAALSVNLQVGYMGLESAQ